MIDEGWVILHRLDWLMNDPPSTAHIWDFRGTEEECGSTRPPTKEEWAATVHLPSSKTDKPWTLLLPAPSTGGWGGCPICVKPQCRRMRKDASVADIIAAIHEMTLRVCCCCVGGRTKARYFDRLSAEQSCVNVHAYDWD